MIRKPVLLLLSLALCGGFALQPSCRTRYEMRMKWAVETVSSAYWECSRWGSAQLKTCPQDTLFSAPYQTCVPAQYWEQFPYYAPPTNVNDYEDECSEDLGQCVNPCLDRVTECNGGAVIDGMCVCPPDSVLEDGVCKFKFSIDVCGDNGKWNAVENYCDCNEGYEYINGWCFQTVGICKDAPEAAYVRGTMDCDPVACTKEQYQTNTLYPTRNPRSFWQCANVGWIEEMPCGAGTCFDFKEQVCIHARDWVNQCK